MEGLGRQTGLRARNGYSLAAELASQIRLIINSSTVTHLRIEAQILALTLRSRSILRIASGNIISGLETMLCFSL